MITPPDMVTNSDDHVVNACAGQSKNTTMIVISSLSKRMSVFQFNASDFNIEEKPHM